MSSSTRLVVVPPPRVVVPLLGVSGDSTRIILLGALKHASPGRSHAPGSEVVASALRGAVDSGDETVDGGGCVGDAGDGEAGVVGQGSVAGWP